MGAPKGNQFAKGNNGGSPTKFRAEYCEQVYKLCLLGATDLDIADFFKVTEVTINNWKKQHKEFFKSMNAGKTIADMEVAHGLYSGTKDRVVVEQQAIKVKVGQWEEDVKVVEVQKVIPSDFRNQQFWLKNRQPKQWRDKQEVENTNFNYTSVELTKEEMKEISKALEDDY